MGELRAGEQGTREECQFIFGQLHMDKGCGKEEGFHVVRQSISSDSKGLKKCQRLKFFWKLREGIIAQMKGFEGGKLTDALWEAIEPIVGQIERCKLCQLSNA